MIKIIKSKNAIASKDSLRNILIGIYILAVLAFSVSSRASTEEIMPVFTDNQPVHAQVYVGELEKNPSNGAYILFLNRSVYFEVESNVDLDAYVGHKVSLEAVRAKFEVAPYYQHLNNINMDTSRPLVITDENMDPVQPVPSANVLIVLQINEVTE